MFYLHFIAFLCIFGTNLLTRWHSVSSCFLLFLYFRKVFLEIFSELDETKVERPILLSRTRSLKEIQRGPRRRPHHVAAWPPLGRAVAWCGPLGRHRHRPSAYTFVSSGKPLTPEPPSTKSSVTAAVVNTSSGGF